MSLSECIKISGNVTHSTTKQQFTTSPHRTLYLILRNLRLQIHIWAPTDDLGVQVLPGFLELGYNAGGRKVIATITFTTTGTRDRLTDLDKSKLSTTSRSYIHDIQVLEPNQAQAQTFTIHGDSKPLSHLTQIPDPKPIAMPLVNSNKMEISKSQLQAHKSRRHLGTIQAKPSHHDINYALCSN
jgi:hypothetical protein